jgi:hypothetical protein
MYVEWDPENGEDTQVWQFDEGDVLRKDATLIEKNFGGSWDQWVAGLQIGQISARTVLLWYMLKLVHPTTRFEDVPDFRVRQLRVQMGVRELKKLGERAKRMKLDPEVRDAFLSQLEMDMKDAMEREGIDGEVVYGVPAIESSAPELVDLPKAP